MGWGGVGLRNLDNMQNEQNRANEEEERRVDSLPGKRYLDLICPRRMPANA